MRKTLYAGLGMLTWKMGKRYLRRRVNGMRAVLPR